MTSATSDSLHLEDRRLVANAPLRREERRVGLLALCLLALAVGVVTGVGAVALRALIALIHNATYLGVFSFRYDANLLEGPSRLRRLGVLFADRRRPDRRLPRSEVRAGGQGPRRAGGDGLGLLQGRQHPLAGRGGEVAGLGAVDRHRRGGRAGRARSSRSARRSARPSRKPSGSRRWQKVTLLSAGAGAGHRGDLQHAARRGAVRPRNPAAGSVQPDLSAGRDRDRRGDPDRPNADRPGPGVHRTGNPVSAGAFLQHPGGARLRAARRALRPRLLGVHPPARRYGGWLSQAAGRPLRAKRRRHGRHRRDDGRPHPRVRPFLRRRRRLRRHPVGAGRPDDRRGAAGAAVRPQARRHDGQPRLRGLGRHFLAVPVPRRDARRARSPRRSASLCRTRA